MGSTPTDRGKRGVKRSLLPEGHGVPLGLVVAGANRHEMNLVRATPEALVVARPRPTAAQPQELARQRRSANRGRAPSHAPSPQAVPDE
jgi:putative transposase